MIYLDSSALLKLLFEEAESAALEAWLAGRADTPVLSSELVKAEIPRATRRLDPEVLPRARRLITQLDQIPITSALLDEAAELEEVSLRSLDAIHLASALQLSPELTAFVAYDARLAEAARAAGLPIVQPG